MRVFNLDHVLAGVSILVFLLSTLAILLMFGFRGGSAGSIRRSRMRPTPIDTILSSFVNAKSDGRLKMGATLMTDVVKEEP